MTDPYYHLFSSVSLDTLMNIVDQNNASSSFIEDIKNINPSEFERSVIGTHISHIFVEMVKIDTMYDGFFKNMTASSWKIVWTVCLCIHLTLKEEEWENYVSKAKNVINEYKWLTSAEEVQLFENLLYQCRPTSFEHNIKQLSDLAYSYFNAYEKKLPFYLTANFMSLIICLLARWCYGCTKYGLYMYEKKFNKPQEEFTEMDKVNIVMYQQKYCKRLLSEVMMIYPSMDRFMYEEHTQFEGKFME